MTDVIEVPGICPLCNNLIEPGQQTAVNEDGRAVHGDCWAATQEDAAYQNRSY
jgi:hypothetical protein